MYVCSLHNWLNRYMYIYLHVCMHACMNIYIHAYIIHTIKQEMFKYICMYVGISYDTIRLPAVYVCMYVCMCIYIYNTYFAIIVYIGEQTESITLGKTNQKKSYVG